MEYDNQWTMFKVTGCKIIRTSTNPAKHVHVFCFSGRRSQQNDSTQRSVCGIPPLCVQNACGKQNQNSPHKRVGQVKDSSIWLTFKRFSLIWKMFELGSNSLSTNRLFHGLLGGTIGMMQRNFLMNWNRGSIPEKLRHFRLL